MKNKENSKAIENLENQAIDATQVKGGGGKIPGPTKEHQRPNERVPSTKGPKRPGKNQWSQSGLSN